MDVQTALQCCGLMNNLLVAVASQVGSGLARDRHRVESYIVVL